MDFTALEGYTGSKIATT